MVLVALVLGARGIMAPGVAGGQGGGRQRSCASIDAQAQNYDRFNAIRETVCEVESEARMGKTEAVL
jgi:hypothetical protein